MGHTVQNSTPHPAGDDDLPIIEPEPWVDLVLEPTPLPAAKPRPQVRKPSGKNAGKSTVKTAGKPAAKPSGKPRAESPASPKTAASSTPAPIVTPRLMGIVAAGLVAIITVALLLRPSSGHAPLPEGLLGSWTTMYMRYEGQTLEFLPDTVVLTLDNADEGRYPILAVETAPAGRETSVLITYRDMFGEKRLDFLADNEPTTALRFRDPDGLIWVRPKPAP